MADTETKPAETKTTEETKRTVRSTREAAGSVTDGKTAVERDAEFEQALVERNQKREDARRSGTPMAEIREQELAEARKARESRES